MHRPHNSGKRKIFLVLSPSFSFLFLLSLFLLVKTGVSCAYTMDDVNNFVTANPAPRGCGNYVVATSNSNGNGYKVVRRCSNQYDPNHPENNFIYVTTYYYGKYSVTDWAPAYRGMWWNCDGIQAHTGNNYLPPGTGPRGAIFGSYREDRIYQYCFGDNYTETYAGSGFGWMRDERCFMGTQGPYQVDCSKYSEKVLAEFVPVSVCDLAITSFTGTSKFIPSTGASIKLSGSISEPSGKSVTWTIAVANKTVSGTGTDPSFSWDGKDASGKVVDAGKYTAVLSIKTEDGNCSDSKSLDFTVEAAPPGQCGLNVDFGSLAHVGSGNLSHSQNLFSTRGTGLTTSMTLYYNSLDPHNGSLGRGWSHNYDISLKETSDGSVLVKEGNWTRRYYNLTNGAYVGGPGDYSTLAKNADGTFAISEKDGTKYNFTSGGTIAKISDRNGNALNFTYAGGNLTTITDPAGRSTTLAYDANHLTSVTDPGGNAYTFGYSGDLLTSVTNPDGGSWSYIYDTNAFMLSKTDPNGNTTSYAYDANHRIASAIDPEGKTRSMAYPEIGIDTATSTAFTEKDGGLWLYGYAPKVGTLTSKTDPDGGVTSYTYDAQGNRTSTTLPDGSTTKYSYDESGNMTSETDALGHTASYTYNEFGQVLTAKDAQGNTTGYSYDPNGNLTSTTDAGGSTTHYSYDATGKVTKISNALGQTTTFGYDEKGNLISATDPAGSTTTYAYDAAGNLSSQTDAVGNTTRFVYDSGNRLIRTIDAQGGTTSYTYDPAGNKTSETDPNGNTTKYEYNYKGHPIKTTDALGNATTYAYGSTGCASCGGGADKLRSLTDANGNSTNYQYNSVGKVVSETDPLGNKTTYSYDANGNLASKTDTNGATITYGYDSHNRLLNKSYPDGTAATFTYDARGNVLTAANQNISYTLVYDADGRVVSVTDSNGRTISYEYDATGNKTSTISPDGRTISYSYDSAGRIKTIVDVGTFTFGYDALGRRSSLTYPNGDTTKYSYDSDGRLTNIVHRNRSGSIIDRYSYTMDRVGNRLSNVEDDRAVSYQYDPVYRLTQALYSSPGNRGSNPGKRGGIGEGTQRHNESYSYDPVGNRLSSHSVSSYAYNPANQLVSGEGNYSYDHNGNLVEKIADGKTTYTWDYENRLIKVATPDATVVGYTYDPFGRRILKKVYKNGARATTTGYFYDDENVIFEYDDTGAIGNRYTNSCAVDEHLAVATTKHTYYYHVDGLGSVTALTDPTGSVVQEYHYNPFGKLKNHQNSVKQPYTYTGREWDKETGLYYYRARYYDPMEGRFISKDPIGFKGQDVNLYGYVHNNPVNNIDPTGKNTIIIGGEIGSLAGPGGAAVGMGLGALLGHVISSTCKDNTDDCEKEWDDAVAFCSKYGNMYGFKGGGRSVGGNNFQQCVKGQVSERCGGNRVE